MRILELSTYDRAGGAEKVAFDLYKAYRERGHDVRLLVRCKRTSEEGVFEVDPYQRTSPWAPACAALERWISRKPRFRGQGRLRKWLRRTAYPRRWLDLWRGIEDFNYPSSHHLLDNPTWHPDVIHAHNLHGDYFDLRALAALSQRVPVIWTLHDAWAFTGHCAHFVDIACERWRTGCGNCPDLKRFPAISRDRTASNWRRKRQIYASSRLAVATPSRWLMAYVEQSILQPWQKRVIPYGLDLRMYKPGDRRQARAVLNLPQNAFICMFIAPSGSSSNHPYKDFVTIDRAVWQVVEQIPSAELLLVCVGENSRGTLDPRFHYTGYLADPQRVLLYYQAADVLLHAANMDNFPCVVLEALDCGTPVVATAVGGIPEQVVEGETGFLVPRGDSALMAQRVCELINRPDLCRQMSLAARAYAQRTFDMDRQAGTYLQWFEELRAAYSDLGAAASTLRSA